ncbi:hypothetical protein ACFLWM_00960 [Chloroflexota bacterium]
MKRCFCLPVGGLSSLISGQDLDKAFDVMPGAIKWRKGRSV